MSAFTVQPKTISYIVSFFYLMKHDAYISSIERQLFNAGYSLKKSEDLKRLANDMYILNQQAVDYRYCDKSQLVDMQFSLDIEAVKPVQAFKHLQCWLYQCCEGDYTNSQLYKLMDSLKSSIADYIVEQSTAYNTAKWDA